MPRPGRETIGERKFRQRLACYRNVLAMLLWIRTREDCFDASVPTTAFNGGGAGAGAGAGGTAPSEDVLRARQAEFLRRLQEALLSPDALFHETLYQWLQSSHEEILVSLRSPRLLNYLKHRANNLELLYKYYVTHQNYKGALRPAPPC